MNIRILYIFSLVVFLMSCSEKQKNANDISLIKISYAPSFHTSAELLLNEDENYLIIKSTRKYIPIVKSDGENIDNEEYIKQIAPVKDTLINIQSEEVQKINNIVSGFKKEDFSDAKFPDFDGMSTNILIVYKNKNIKVIQPMNVPNDKQRELLIALAKLSQSKVSTDNKVVMTSILSYLQ
ncbi:hypothetical protein [Soonwooa sp.]|uniref:hypothetical protein n=1 Tax=Soonwooa sp. TaxID=1938592 RepID=UPI00260E764D|nr:hypothetical protein [Soonwooa sp.]